jgi:hypothetical protein
MPPGGAERNFRIQEATFKGCDSGSRQSEFKNCQLILTANSSCPTSCIPLSTFHLRTANIHIPFLRFHSHADKI